MRSVSQIVPGKPSKYHEIPKPRQIYYVEHISDVHPGGQVFNFAETLSILGVKKITGFFGFSCSVSARRRSIHRLCVECPRGATEGPGARLVPPQGPAGHREGQSAHQGQYIPQ